MSTYNGWSIASRVPQYANSRDMQKFEIYVGMRSPVRCRATNRQGRPCGKWAADWQLVCKFHGGGIYKSMEAAERRQEAAHRMWDRSSVEERSRIFPAWPPDHQRPKQVNQATAAKKANAAEVRWVEAEEMARIAGRLANPVLGLVAHRIERRRTWDFTG